MAAMKGRITNPSNRYIHELQESPSFMAFLQGTPKRHFSLQPIGYAISQFFYMLRDKLDQQTLVEEAAYYHVK
jgi:hypothetical protein